MSWFRHLKIRTKLLVSFVLIALIGTAVGVVGDVYLRTLSKDVKMLYGNNVVPLGLMTDIQDNYQKMRLKTRDMLLSNDSQADKQAVKDIADLQKSVEKDLAEFHKAADMKEIEQDLGAAEKGWSAYLQVEAKILEYASAGQDDKAKAEIAAAANIAKNMDDSFDKLQESTSTDAQRTFEGIVSTANTAGTTMILVVIFGALVSLGLGLFISAIISNPLKKLTDVAGKLAIGDINVRVEANSQDEIGQLSVAFNNMIANIKGNADAANLVAAGDLSAQVKALSEQDVMGKSLHTMIETIRALVNETLALATAATEGKLQTRGNADKFSGSYKEIVVGINNTFNEVLKPMNEAVDCLKQMAQGNLDVKMAGKYEGDYNLIKDALNTTIDSINDLLIQFSAAVDQVAAGSRQVSDSSQALSQGATESASAVEETSASMHEMASQTNQNAENALQANHLAISARDNAEKGNLMMSQMVGAMSEINESASNISKIIKVIDDIAFQTNLLALNAAVEAARAGKHGKGFTVVAEEVRNLAQRSAKAAKETTEMIEGSIKKTAVGTQIATDTSKSLGDIVAGATKVTDLISEIASASKEQAQGINQINQGLSQVDIVTQQNTASSEELASAGEELSSQAAQLKGMLNRFKLRRQYFEGAVRQSRGRADNMQNYGRSTAQQEAAATRAPESRGWGTTTGNKALNKSKRAAEIIALDDSDFGDF